MTKRLFVVIPLALAVNGCAVNPYADSFTHLKQTFASDDPCANNARNTGMLVGAVVGAVAGHQLARKEDRLLVAALGAGLGAGIGNLIGSEVDSRRCELARIQKKYNLDMQVASVQVGGAGGTAKSSGTHQVGLSVAVIDSGLRPQFASNSAQLSQESQLQFAEIARQYAVSHQLAQLGTDATAEQRKALGDELRRKRVLLVGHTDDTGDTRRNAELSEQRAKAVAELFRAQGVTDDQLYYQGAGETLPLADNRTTEGRARNRRVEIVDLSNEETFRLYLNSRRANTGYYRSAHEAETNTVKPKVTAPSAPAKSSTATAPSSVIAGTSVRQPNGLDFGGVPYSRSVATLDIGALRQPSSGISVISKAQASNDMSAISSCRDDRPRSAGLVKSLKGNRAYATSEMMPGLYGRTWHEMVNGNLVVLNKVAVLSNGSNVANLPELKVYAGYDPSRDRNAKPTVELSPAVNTYLGSNGLLYRVFVEGKGGVQCMDILMSTSQSGQARAGKIVYGAIGHEFVADFRPRMVGGQ